MHELVHKISLKLRRRVHHPPNNRLPPESKTHILEPGAPRGPGKKTLIVAGWIFNNHALVALAVLVPVYLNSFGDLSYMFENTCEIYHE